MFGKESLGSNISGNERAATTPAGVKDRSSQNILVPRWKLRRRVAASTRSRILDGTALLSSQARRRYRTTITVFSGIAWRLVGSSSGSP